MARRTHSARPNYRLVKIYFSYTVEEAANLLDVHRNTVREWIKRGLPTSDSQRPTLILGRALAEFLETRRQRNRRPCTPGEIYCVRCRAPRRPAGDVVDCNRLTDVLGDLIGICPACDTLIYRRVNLTKLEQIRGHLQVTITQAAPRLSESDAPSLNSDIR